MYAVHPKKIMEADKEIMSLENLKGNQEKKYSQ